MKIIITDRLIGAAFAAKNISLARIENWLSYICATQVRDYIDALDGSIYRERSHSHAAGQVPKQSVGWAVDGICDGIGDAFRMVAMLFLLHRFLGSGPRFVLSTVTCQINPTLYFSSASTEATTTTWPDPAPALEAGCSVCWPRWPSTGGPWR